MKRSLTQSTPAVLLGRGMQRFRLFRRNASRPGRAARGFTLIEVVVALLLGAGSIGALLSVFSGADDQADRAARSRMAWLQAQSAMDAALAGPLNPGWRLQGLGPALVWRAEVSAADEASPPLRLVQVAVWALGAGGPVGEPLARLQTLRIAPGDRNAER